MSYASGQAIRESAGLLSRAENETPNGAVNSSNRVFVAKRRPIVDSNYDDQVDPSDVRAYVNAVPVTVSAVEADTGKITLAVAPNTGTKVTVDYKHSPLADDYIAGKQEESDSWVNLKIRASRLKKPPTIPLDPVPGLINTAAELYAAGLILIRDWGSRADTQLTSKDGKAKIDQARELVKDYLDGMLNEEQQDNQNNQGGNSVSTASDGDVFNRDPEAIPELQSDITLDDDAFMRRQ